MVQTFLVKPLWYLTVGCAVLVGIGSPDTAASVARTVVNAVATAGGIVAETLPTVGDSVQEGQEVARANLPAER